MLSDILRLRIRKQPLLLFIWPPIEFAGYFGAGTVRREWFLPSRMLQNHDLFEATRIAANPESVSEGR